MTSNVYESPESLLQENFQQAPELKHCGIGVSAFILTMVSFILLAGSIGFAGYLEATTPGGVNETSPLAIAAGLGILFSGLLLLVSLVLSIISVCGKNKKKLFSILALVFNVILFLMVVGLMIIGTMMS